MNITNIVSFILLYCVAPCILTVIHLQQKKSNEDRGSFDLTIAMCLIYLAISTVINYFIGDATRYVVGLTVFIAIKDAILYFEKGNTVMKKFYMNH